MLNIASERMITISKAQYDNLQKEIKKLRAQNRLSKELQKGFISSLDKGTVSYEEVLGKLGFEKYEN